MIMYSNIFNIYGKKCTMCVRKSVCVCMKIDFLLNVNIMKSINY